MDNSTLFTPNLDSIPLSAPPPGIIPNFVNPESRAHRVYIAAGVCLPIILFFACIRFYAKTFLVRAWTKDDYSFILSLSAGCTYIGLVVALVHGGAYGFHAWDVTLSSFPVEQTRLTLVLLVVYGPLVWLIKLSLFLLYLEIFGRLRWARYLVYFGITVTGLSYFSLFVAQAVLCSPRDGQSPRSYLTALASARCAQNKPLNASLGCINIISDFYILFIPLPVVWSLQLPRRRKIGVSAIFLTGLLACICSILSLIFRIHVNNGTDITWTAIPLWIVTIMEVTAGVIVPCMHTVAALWQHCKPRISSFLSKYRSKLRSITVSSETPYELKETDSSAKLHPNHDENSYRIISETQVVVARERPAVETCVVGQYSANISSNPSNIPKRNTL